MLGPIFDETFVTLKSKILSSHTVIASLWLCLQLNIQVAADLERVLLEPQRLRHFVSLPIGVTKVSFNWDRRDLGLSIFMPTCGGVISKCDHAHEADVASILQGIRRNNFRSRFEITKLLSISESGNYSARLGGAKTC